MIGKLLSKLTGPIKDLISEVLVDRDKKKEINAKIDELTMQFTADYEEELTKRHELDMKSDSWLSKNIRPMSLIFLTTVLVVLSFFDGNVGEFTVDSAYVAVYQSLLGLAYTFYFGSRGFEKITKIYTDNKKQD